MSMTLEESLQHMKDLKDKEAREAAKQQMLNDQTALAEKYSVAREGDMAKGRARGQELFGEGKLGRINAERSADISDVIARRKSMLEGYTPEEKNAMRDENIRSMQRQTEGQARSLRGAQAASGVRGATASAQNVQLAKGQQDQSRQMERDLFLKNADARRAALGAFEQSATGAEATETSKQQYNIGQKNAELQAQLATEFGYANLGSADRAAAAQQTAAMYTADAQRDAAKEKGKKK
jgi:hypothetical protein